jgi:hypothetical protein
MKTLGELAKELRTAVGDFGLVMDEAADRFTAIEKAWHDWIDAQKTGDEARKQPALSALRDLIEGREP